MATSGTIIDFMISFRLVVELRLIRKPRHPVRTNDVEVSASARLLGRDGDDTAQLVSST